MKFRTNTHDIMPPTRTKAAKPGAIGQQKLGVYDRGPDGELRLRGQVGVLATSSTAARFHGKLGSKIGKGPDGKKAWIAPTSGPNKAAAAANAKLAKQLKMDRGSVKSKS
jgi:hypothetical protein